MTSLSFSTLRAANIRRLPLFKNAQGQPAHSQPDGSDWSIAEWVQASLGEFGELANLLKKLKRGDFNLNDDAVRHQTQCDIAREFADIITYLDITALQFGVDLGEATRLKFNEVSRRVSVDVFIDPNNECQDTDPGDTDYTFTKDLPHG